MRGDCDCGRGETSEYLDWRSGRLLLGAIQPDTTIWTSGRVDIGLRNKEEIGWWWWGV